MNSKLAYSIKRPPVRPSAARSFPSSIRQLVFLLLMCSIGLQLVKADALDHWTRVGTLPRPYDVTYGNGSFVAVRPTYPGSDAGDIYHSTHGVTWEHIQFSGYSPALSRVAYGAGCFAAAGWAGA